MEVISPGPEELVLVSPHELLRAPELMHLPPSWVGQGYRREPELGDLTGLLDVDMGWLAPLVAVEEEAQGTDPSHGGHGQTQPRRSSMQEQGQPR
jgi:hypothetical protein